MSERLYTEGELMKWLETTGITPRPDYVDDLLTQTAGSRQRPAWRFPERWLPMEISGPCADDHGAAGSAPADRACCAPRSRTRCGGRTVRRLATASAGPVRPRGQRSDRVRRSGRPVMDERERLPASAGRHHERRPRDRHVLGARRRPDGRRLPGRVAGRHPRGIRPRDRPWPDALRRRYIRRRPTAADPEAPPGDQ